MERRSFLKGAAALVASPSLPAKALASFGGVGSAATTGATAIAAQKSAVDLAYIWCRMYAENKPNFKPELLTEHLGFSKEIAQSAFKRLLKNDVIRPTDIRGIYQSTKPFVDMSKIYNPTTHFENVVKTAKDSLPKIELETTSPSEKFDDQDDLLDDDQQLAEAQIIENEIAGAGDDTLYADDTAIREKNDSLLELDVKEETSDQTV